MVSTGIVIGRPSLVRSGYLPIAAAHDLGALREPLRIALLAPLRSRCCEERRSPSVRPGFYTSVSGLLTTPGVVVGSLQHEIVGARRSSLQPCYASASAEARTGDSKKCPR